MKKQLYFIGGTMGVGKTTVCRILQRRLPNSVFLDGDWCWDAHPFTVTEETKRMVKDNICHLLNNFLRCSAYEHIIFCWVMQEQQIWDELLSRLELADCELHKISLLCTPEALIARLQRDIDAGLRQSDVLERSLTRLPLYASLRTEKLDVSALSPEETAERILNRKGKRPNMKKVRITVIRKALYPDLIAKYENPIQHACDLQEGQSWIAEGGQKPDGFCDSAWDSLSPFVLALSHGGGNFYDGWMKDPHTAMISCNDGFRPVSFLLEVVEETLDRTKSLCYTEQEENRQSGAS